MTTNVIPASFRDVVATGHDGFNTIYDAPILSPLGSCLLDVNAPNGTAIFPNVMPVGMGEKWARGAKRGGEELTFDGKLIRVDKYSDMLWQHCEDREDFKQLLTATMEVVGSLKKSAMKHLQERPFHTLLENPENLLTGSPMFGKHVLRMPGREDDESAPTSTITNEIVGSDNSRPSFYFLGEKAMVRATQSQPVLQLPQFDVEQFERDVFRAAWRARCATVAGNPAAALRVTGETFTADLLKEVRAMTAGWRNQRGDYLAPRLTHIVFRADDPNLELAKDLLLSPLLQGSTNRFATEPLQILTF